MSEIKVDEPTSNITNDEKVEVNQTVNKKLSEMSKEAKTRKTKRKLEKPPKDTSTDVSTLTSNQIYMLLAVVGVIIAGASLYYQRKSFFKNEKSKVETPEIKDRHRQEQAVLRPVVVDPEETPVSPQLPGMYSF